MKIYTRVGDAGTTRRIDGKEIRKDEARVHAVGSVDEANCALGLAILRCRQEGLADIAAVLEPIQGELFALGANLASAATDRPIALRLGPEVVGRMEEQIDQACKKAGKLEHFILPGGSMLSASLHVARSVCRRAVCGPFSSHRS